MTDKTNQTKQGNFDIKKLMKAAASLKLTVICLIVLTVLVFWGTLYQADHGLYQAQQKFFHSWFFLVFGFIPFPGAVLTMFVLFINLVCSIFFRIGFRAVRLGMIITHLGIIVLLVGGFFTFYYSGESSLLLKEGESSSMSSSRLAWEVALWEEKNGERDVLAVDTADFTEGHSIGFADWGLELRVEEYYRNCSAFDNGADQKVTNASGIRLLKGKPAAVEAAENVAGGVFSITSVGQPSANKVLLYGQENQPTALTLRDRTFFFSLRKKKNMLPLNIELEDFRLIFYPNSQIPKSYESTVAISAEGAVERSVVISMNKPFRFKNFTFFQSGYHIGKNGTEYSILAVVQNSGRLLPYFSSIIIFLGMVIHFLQMLFKRRKETPTGDEHQKDDTGKGDAAKNNGSGKKGSKKKTATSANKE
ncbi:MAG: hypothetical protein GY765_33330 [bacterium]|nr:hypothetical protein [bacterium]